MLDETPAAPPAEKPAELELPVFEVPATFGTQVEEGARSEKKAPLGAKNKPTSRQRKGTSNGTATPRRRRTTTSTPQVTPNTDDAS